LTRQPSFRDSELVSDLVASPCDTGVQIGDSFLDAQPLDYRAKSAHVASSGSSSTSRIASFFIGLIPAIRAHLATFYHNPNPILQNAAVGLYGIAVPLVEIPTASQRRTSDQYAGTGRTT
jgi:hypothetical protein